MPSLAPYHPIIVHFAIALLVVGVLFRGLFLTGRAAFAGPAAATLLLLGTVAVLGAMQSGELAHRPVERVPGTQDAVMAHELWATRTRNVFLIIAGLEILGLIFSRNRKVKVAYLASALVGLAGLYTLFNTGRQGGDLVYSYAGGVGIRTQDPADVGRLLLAGLYQQSQLDRKEGRLTEAHQDLVVLQQHFPQDPAVQLLVAESWLVDLKNPATALAELDKITISPENRGLVVRRGLILADAQLSSGRGDLAGVTLRDLQKEFPNNPMLKRRLAQMRTTPKPVG